MHALDLAELRNAARSIEFMINKAKREFNFDPDIDPYTIVYPSGALVLGPMLAAQITIVQQIEKLEAADGSGSGR